MSLKWWAWLLLACSAIFTSVAITETSYNLVVVQNINLWSVANPYSYFPWYLWFALGQSVICLIIIGIVGSNNGSPNK